MSASARPPVGSARVPLGGTRVSHASAASDPRLQALAWPLDRLGEALEALARAAGFAPQATEALQPPAAVQSPQAPQAEVAGSPTPAQGDVPATLQAWLDWAAARLGLEVEPATAQVPEVLALLPQAGPALLPLADAQGATTFLLLLPSRGAQLRLLGPDRQVRRWPAARLREALCQPFEAPLAGEIDALLLQAEVAPRRQAAVRAALLRERLADTRLAPWWQLRLPPSAPLAAQAWQAGLPQRLLGMVAVFAALYAGEILAWGLVGEGVLSGRLDGGWLIAWVLLLFTLLPLRVGGSGLQAGFARRAASLLKARLLVGALHLDVDRVRREGVGALLGRVIESSALESLAVGGGLSTVVALIELVAAGVVLSLGAAGGAHLALLAAWALVVALACSRVGLRLADWTRQRLALTHALIEQMVGHRTRLAQEQAARREAQDDAALEGYLHRSQALDRALLPLQVWLPAGWMAASLAVLVPGFLAGMPGGSGTAALAISVGGILLAQRAFAGLAGGLGSLARAGIAWQQVAELYRAGAREGQRLPAVFIPRPDGRGTATAGADTGPLIDAQGLHFAHTGGQPVLRGVDLRIQSGERVLLQGPSGGGKSTLAALLTGLRQPQAGLLLLQGLDAPTLGDQWQAWASAAPQFHENHVLSGTVAFNLLMGRQWPPTRATLAEAEALCQELGLGDLLRRMPAGLQQRIGETGWQISHGERSRLFLARALLQRAPLTVLDESFAALDPENLRQCLGCVQRHAGALVVIAHP